MARPTFVVHNGANSARCASRVAHDMFGDGAPARFALLLHGKIGRLNRTASEVVKENVVASRELITLCSRSHLHFIVAANSGSAGGVDVTTTRTPPIGSRLVG